MIGKQKAFNSISGPYQDTSVTYLIEWNRTVFKYEETR